MYQLNLKPAAGRECRIEGMKMNLYFAGLDPKTLNLIQDRHVPIKPLNVLVSMADMTPTLHGQLRSGRETGLIGKLALDSGTFTLNKPNSKLDAQHFFNRFKEYATAHPRMYDLIFNFDRWFTPDAFEENYSYASQLGKCGIPVIPVAHDVLHGDYNQLAERGHEAIAFGQDKNRNVGTLLHANYELIQQGVNIRHGLGILDPKTLMFVPFTSVDASTAKQDGVSRKVHYIDATKPKGQQWRLLNVKGPKGKTTPAAFKEQKNALMAWLESIDANILWGDLTGKNGRNFCTIVNILFYQTVEPVIEANNKIVSHYLETGDVLNEANKKDSIW